MAQYEEEEALNIQKRLLESISDADLGIDFLIDTKTKIGATPSNLRELGETKREKVELDLKALTKAQKQTIIQKESPELELLLADCKKYLDELTNQLEPMLKGLIKRDAVPSSGLKYLKLRYSVLLNYCINISFYLSLMTSRDKSNIKEHPIIKEIFMHKKMITELDACFAKRGKRFINEIDFVTKQTNGEIKFINESANPLETSSTANEIIDSTFDLSAAHSSEDDALDDRDAVDDNEAEGDNISGEEKRAITYEMEKNKGLIPKRKREQRNPRVKYRKKFENAIIRRKGQVRAPRHEIKKYGGEMTGINARTIKSVKFK